MSMISRPSKLFWRTVVAVMLVVSFYTFALVVAGGLLYISYLTFVGTHVGLMLKVGLTCLVSGLVILWSIIPRLDRFPSPGPRLLPAGQPELFGQITAIAQAMQQAVPCEVYLVADVNAWVAERGGFMGLGSRRVMAIGLPLLQSLSVAEFRAVLAHEFGHYYGGDTKLAPWIYKTRTAISRTLQSLDEGLIHIVFRAYGKLFLRITHSISRYQEFVADEAAAAIAGAPALASGLRKLHAASFAYNGYWRSEFLPALQAGYLPPYTGGFAYFMQKSSIQEAMAASVDEELAATRTSPYDTHPALRDRLQALAQQAADRPADDTSAVTLLSAVPALEKELFQTLGGEAGQELQPTDWPRIGEQVYLPTWSALAGTYQSVLAGITMETVADIAREPADFISKIELHDNRQMPGESGLHYARQLLGVAIADQLARQGWQVSALPGEAVKLMKEEKEFAPFTAMYDLFTKNMTRLAWREMCQERNIYEMSLGLNK